MSGATVGSRPAPSSTDGWLGALQRTSRIGMEPERTLPCVILEGGAVFGDAAALIGEAETLTHRELAARLRGYAGWALAQGLRKGDVVALLMPNQPDYLAIWLGLTQVGVVVALLNTNLDGEALAHCLRASGATHVVVADALSGRWEGARPLLADPPCLWTHGAGPSQNRIQGVPNGPATADMPAAQRPTLADKALLIFTSGTTGLPKAAHVSHHRLMTWSFWFAGLLDIGPEDRMFDCLPFYHSIGGVVATGSLLVAGGSVVVREKFSASRFWDDVVAEGCTLFQYIGELCRYLATSQPHPLERSHRLRAVAGNGLRADVWETFQARFAVPRVLEFYAATEGTVTLYNVEGKVGAVGRVPAFMAHRSPAALVAHDVETGVPVRGPDGSCSRVPRGTVGELIGRLADDPAQAAQRFEGYTNEDDTARKVLRDVFRPGDAWMRTGDLMRQDDKGFFYFIDRIGDTYRWRGENVATTEVAETVAQAPGVRECAVYGVAVPGIEGRAGMAAIVVDARFDLGAFRSFCAARLPAYARPVFVRLCDGLDVTETFKLKKTALASAGADPGLTTDRIFVDDSRRAAYVAVDSACWSAIASGALRL